MGMYSLLKFEGLHDVLLLQLKELYNAEGRILEALPRMARAAESAELAEIFQRHRDQTETHMRRLEQVFDWIGFRPEPEMSSTMKGLVLDGEEILLARGSDRARDMALIGAAQRVEHYEIAGYRAARTLANRMNLPELADLFEQTLKEEIATDKSLNGLAEGQA